MTSPSSWSVRMLPPLPPNLISAIWSHHHHQTSWASSQQRPAIIQGKWPWEPWQDFFLETLDPWDIILYLSDFHDCLRMCVGEIISENPDRWPSGEQHAVMEGRIHYLIPKEHWPFATKMGSDFPAAPPRRTTQKMSTWPSLSWQLRSSIKVEVNR